MRHNVAVALAHYRLCISPSRDGRRLDHVLADWLPSRLRGELSRSAVRRLIMAGVVRLEGRPVRRPGLLLAAGQRLEVAVDSDRLSRSERASGVRAGVAGGLASAVEVLYQDRWLVAVAKPSGLLVHASADPGRPDLFTSLRHRLQASGRDDRAPEPYLGLHHRLDLEASGVMLFTTDLAANAGLARAFAGREVEKVYHAIVACGAAIPPSGWVECARLEPSGTGRRMRMSAAEQGGLPAETRFAVCAPLREALLVEARPVTGRKHQIRAHLALRGMPILGDVRYGGAVAIAGLPVGRVMLHARALRLVHPVLGTPLEIRCNYPEDFRALLAALGASLDTPEASR
jgi:RluA family pseudouridine synthase